ncbi:hypothetical protein BGY98DRAFT_582220 [Russula aff. rugulosa BPL654]|nr:hypothetical protein BGY98DRAFT_582220 [Russula aff. rugulosa BPL654]
MPHICRASIRTNMKFSLTLPIIFSALWVSSSQAQTNLSSCVTSCAQIEGSQTGCNTTNLTSTSCFCTNAQFVTLAAECVLANCSDTDAQAAETYWEAVCLPQA